MEGVTVVDHVLLRRLLSILRDQGTSHRVFRETLTDAALILGYEAMRGLRGTETEVQTPLEPAPGVRLADEVFVVDPMLATGGSATQAIARLKRAGAQRLTFVCLVAAPEGVRALQAAHPDVPIMTAALDRELDSNGYIRPGLGDAGDRIFGTDR